MSRCSLFALFALLGLLGCDAGGGDLSDGAAVRPGQDAQLVEDAGRERTACDSLALAAQCPPGSNPTVLVSGCVEGAEFTDADGQTTGFCARQGECLFACNFESPCRCGIDRITVEGVFCTDCREAAACGDAQCDRGESAQSCPIDCGEICVPDNERCDGNVRQECEETGRWASLRCRRDQQCEFDAQSGQVLTVCQTRISQAGGTYLGFGAQEIPVEGDPAAIRFRQASFEGDGVRFVSGGTRVLVKRDRFVVIDPAGVAPDRETNIVPGFQLAISPNRVAVGRRWPRLGAFFEDTDRTVEPMVHDRAVAEYGAVALSENDEVLAATFAVGLPGGDLEAVLGIWNAVDGSLSHLVRYVDPEVVSNSRAAEAIALSRTGEMAVEARPGGIVLVWNVGERRYARILRTNVGLVERMVVSPAGDDGLLIGGTTGSEYWLLANNEPDLQWREAGEATRAIAIAPDGSVVAVGTRSGTALRDATTGRLLFTFAETGALDFDPRGGRLLVGSAIYSAEL